MALKGFADLCLTTWLPRRVYSLAGKEIFLLVNYCKNIVGECDE
jgi:hypothetical protein